MVLSLSVLLNTFFLPVQEIYCASGDFILQSDSKELIYEHIHVDIYNNYCIIVMRYICLYLKYTACTYIYVYIY